MRIRSTIWVMAGVLALLVAMLVWREATRQGDRTIASDKSAQPIATDSAKPARQPALTNVVAVVETAAPTSPLLPVAAPLVLERLRFLDDASQTVLAIQEQANWLAAPFNAAESEQLFRYLESPETHGRTLAGDAAIRNGLLNALRRDPELAARLSELLHRMALNAELPAVFRDYALQHLISLIGVGEPSPAAWELLDELAAAGETSLRGTALLGMARLEGAHPRPEQLDQLAYRSVLAAYDSSNEESQISALALVGDLAAADALPAAVEALNLSASVPVRIAALGAIGKLGGNEHLPLLRTILDGAEEPLKPAAGTALARISERNL
jgi:hypothetical protein